MDQLGLGRRSAVVIAAVVSILGGCASGTPPSSWTFTSPAAAVSPSAAGGQSAGSTATPAASANPAASATPAATETTAATATSGPTAGPTAGSSVGPSSGPIGVPPQETAVYLSEWSVGLPTSMLAGQVNFSITNIGTIQHELLVFKSDLPPSAVPVDKNGNIVEDGPGITLVSRGDKIDPGKTQARTVDLTQPGSLSLRLQLSRATSRRACSGPSPSRPPPRNRPTSRLR